jgi:hypothetical protein
MRQGWRLLEQIWGKKMLFNVPAVTDVFLRPMRKNAKHFYGRKKMWRNKTVQRAKPEHGFV